MMNMKKMLALLLAVVMVVGMIPFGAMAEETVTHIETCLEGCALEDCACTCHTAPETPTEETKQEQSPVAPASLDDTQTEETPVCTCTPVEGVHAAECALYVAPEAPVVEPKVDQTPVCTCTPVEDVHAAECALYVAPVVPEEEVQDEPASVDYAEVYNALMAAASMEEVDAIFAALSAEQFDAFTVSMTAEQDAALTEKLDALHVIPEEDEEEPVEDTPQAEREIIYPAVDFTNAAGFLDPVEGPKPMLMRLMGRAAGGTETDNGLELNKSVRDGANEGEYILTLEAWATGAKTIIESTTSVPTDIILVLDQSGSMTDNFTSAGYSPLTNPSITDLYNNRDNVYVKRNDGSYAPVSVSFTNDYSYNTIGNNSRTNGNLYDTSRLYHACSDGRYGEVDVSRTAWNGTYTYTCENGCTLGTSESYYNTPSFADELRQRSNYANSRTYTISYTNEDGETQTATVAQNGNPPEWNFYLHSNQMRRIDGLKIAVRNFAAAVADKAKGADGALNTEDDVDHTISMVGFGRANYGNDPYLNSEVFIGSTAYEYGTSARGQYANVPQDMSTQAGINNVEASINALDASGGTYVDLGLEMANGILNAKPVPSGEQRNRVVIVFTDGAPGYNGSFGNGSYGNQNDAGVVANKAIAEAYKTKNEYGATVYTVGIFDGANASNPTQLPDNNNTGYNRHNRFMYLMSSNYLKAQSMTDVGTLNGAVSASKSYYLSASDASALNSIFQTISQDIEDGGASTTLSENAVIKDVITDQFELPENADSDDIKVYTAEYTAENTFAERQEFDDATVEIVGKTISVTNFNYSENWVGTETKGEEIEYRGQKLIIEIPIEVRDGFLGGNNVLTNGDGSGLYADDSADEPVEEFESPSVDILIDDVTVTAPVHNVYLLGSLTADQIIPKLDVTVGDVALDMNAANFGLESWQTAYVSINDSDIAALSNLTEDTTYSVEVTVTPNSPGAATEKSDEGIGDIHVFKPYIVYQDSSIEANTLPKYEENNFVSETWKHGDTVADPTKMTGDAPDLYYNYEPTQKVLNVETNVKASVAISAADGKETDVTEYVTFWRNECTAENGCDFEGGAVDAKNANRINFVVHMKTFDLIIKKQGVNENLDSNAPFVFNVSGKGVNMNVVIYGNDSVTIKGLPSGTYTVEETSGYWRYEIADASLKSQSVTANGPTATVTFVNERTENKWLDDWASATNNFS